MLYTGNESIGGRSILYYPFTTTASGTVGVLMDWTLPANDIDIYLGRGTAPCSLEQINSVQCPWVGSAESKTAKPERLSVPNLAAGPYILYIANF